MVLELKSKKQANELRDKPLKNLHACSIVFAAMLLNQQIDHQESIVISRLAAPRRQRLDVRFQTLESRVRVSATPCGFRGIRNGVWAGFSRGLSHFPLSKI